VEREEHGEEGWEKRVLAEERELTTGSFTWGVGNGLAVKLDADHYPRQREKTGHPKCAGEYKKKPNSVYIGR